MQRHMSLRVREIRSVGISSQLHKRWETGVKMLEIRSAVTMLLLGVALLTASYAQITPSQDAYTNTADPTTNFGAATLLDVSGATEIAYIQFNLLSIPAGASVSQATLKLYVNAVTKAGSFNVDYVNGTWSESKITSSLAPALGTAIVSSVPLTTASKNQYILIDITPAVVAWLNGSQANDGIALVANSTFNASFDSKENTGTSHPAELDIVFAGGGSGITGVTAGTDLTGGGTSGNVTLNLDTTKVPQLNSANAFVGNQGVVGNVTVTGAVGIGTTTPSLALDLGNNNNMVIRVDPGNDTTAAIGGYSLVGRGAGGVPNTWWTLTAPVGGGFGVPVNSYSIWQYPPNAVPAAA